MQPHSNKMSQSFIFASHGRHFDISSVRSALRSSCTGRPGRTTECGASKARMGWTSSGSSPADSAHQASSQGIICGTLCFDYFYFLLLLANHESAGNTSASTLGKSHGNVINVLRDFSTGWSITILRIIRELLFSGTDGKHTSASALVASLSPASLKRWALLLVRTNWPSLQPQSCKYDNKGQCLQVIQLSPIVTQILKMTAILCYDMLWKLCHFMAKAPKSNLRSK